MAQSATRRCACCPELRPVVKSSATIFAAVEVADEIQPSTCVTQCRAASVRSAAFAAKETYFARLALAANTAPFPCQSTLACRFLAFSDRRIGSKTRRFGPIQRHFARSICLCCTWRYPPIALRHSPGKNLKFSVFAADFTRLLIIWGAVGHAMGRMRRMGRGLLVCRVRFLDRAYRRDSMTGTIWSIFPKLAREFRGSALVDVG